DPATGHASTPICVEVIDKKAWTWDGSRDEARGSRDEAAGEPPKRLPSVLDQAPYTEANVKLTVTFLQPFWLVALSIMASVAPDGENVLTPDGRSAAIEF